MHRTITVIMNARAGLDDDGATRAILDRRGIAVVEVASGEEIAAAVQAAIAGGSRIVAAAGGDGTVNAVAQQLLGTEASLGIIPFGTFNFLAKALAIPLEPEAAVDVLLNGRGRRIDVGDVNGRIFLSTTTVGVHPLVASVRERHRASLRAGNWRAFWHALYAVLRRPPVFTLYLQADGREVLRRANAVFIGSHTYALRRLRIVGHARPDDGLLTMYVPRASGVGGMALLALRAFLGLAREGKHYDMIRTKEALIERRKKELKVTVDGEVQTLVSPLRYTLHPAALEVIVPA